MRFGVLGVRACRGTCDPSVVGVGGGFGDFVLLEGLGSRDVARCMRKRVVTCTPDYVALKCLLSKSLDLEA